MSEREKRQYAGLEAMKIGYNGVAAISQKLGIHTIRRGKKELKERVVIPLNKVRQKCGGRKKTFVIKDLIEIILLILNSCTKYNPMNNNILRENLTLKEIQEKLKHHL